MALPSTEPSAVRILTTFKLIRLCKFRICRPVQSRRSVLTLIIPQFTALAAVIGRCSNDPDKECQYPPAWNTVRSCRLYPETDSMSCEYTDDKGAQYKGWYGYCLERDRAPGNTEACLLWWPVDIIQGEYWGPDFGYNDRYPLYYCLSAQGNYDQYGFCADKEIAYNPNVIDEGWGYFSPFYSGFAQCGGGLLGDKGGHTIVDFNNGFVDGQGPNGPEDNNPPNIVWKDAKGVQDGERWDLTIDAGCGSDQEATEILVSNDLKNWISVGVILSGAKHCWCGFEGNCCPAGSGSCDDSSYRCGCGGVHVGWRNHEGDEASQEDREKEFYDNLDNASKGLMETYARVEAGFYTGGASELAIAIFKSFGIDLTKFFDWFHDNTIGQIIDKWFGGGEKENQFPETYRYLPYFFDLKGTDAEGGHFKYVKAITLWADNSDEGHKGGPEIGGIKAYYQPAACEWLAQTITPSGQGKPWLSRVNKSGNFNIEGHYYGDDWPPFGAAVPPEPVGNPAEWDSRVIDDFPGKQPLYAEAPNAKDYKSPYQARAGTPYSWADKDNVIVGVDNIKQLFAENYGIWKWGGSGFCKVTNESCEIDDCPGGGCVIKSRCTLDPDLQCEITNCTDENGKGFCNNKGVCKEGDNINKYCCPPGAGVCGKQLSDEKEAPYYGVCLDGDVCQNNCGQNIRCQAVSNNGKIEYKCGGVVDGDLCSVKTKKLPLMAKKLR